MLKMRELSTDDVIIAVMGPTGAGKSTFISNAHDRAGRARVGHSLKSYTTNVEPIRVSYGNRSVVLVDTPGFDDTHLPDTEILRRIAVWLQESYRGDVKLAGIIYMHRISDNRMAGSPLKNLTMFSHLCGTTAAQSVVLATTMWDRVTEAVGLQREQELERKFWKGMIDCGAMVQRFQGNLQSAWEIIDAIANPRRHEALLLQEELVDLQRKLSETQAGKTLYNTLQKHLDQQKRVLQELEMAARDSSDTHLADELKAQYEATQKQLEDTFRQVKELKISIGRRILQLFNFKRAHSAPIKI